MEIIEICAKIKIGIIQIPSKYKGIVAEDVQVILIFKSEKKPQPDIIDELMAKPLNVKGFKPMTRGEVYARK